MKDNRCTYCGQEGHRASHCPRRPRSTFNRPMLARREAKQLAYTPCPRPIAAASGLLAQAMAMNGPEPTERAIAVLLKTPDRKDQRIRDSANGEACLLLYPGCPQDRAMTVWSHNRHGFAGKGGSMKALDLNGAYGCTYCDDIYDGQRPLPPGLTREQAELGWGIAHAKSLVILRQKRLA